MESDREEIRSHRDNETNNQKEWRASYNRSVVTRDMLASWQAKYAIPSLVIMIIPEPSNHAGVPLVEFVVLNSTILHAGLRLPIPKVVRKFLSFWGIALT